MSYPIGMICIGQNLQHNLVHNGVECEIIGGYEQYRIGTNNSIPCEPYYIMGYRVKWSDNGHISVQEQYQLRPKHEPGSWDDEEFQETLKLLDWNPMEKIYDTNN